MNNLEVVSQLRNNKQHLVLLCTSAILGAGGWVLINFSYLQGGCLFEVGLLIEILVFPNSTV